MTIEKFEQALELYGKINCLNKNKKAIREAEGWFLIAKDVVLTICTENRTITLPIPEEIYSDIFELIKEKNQKDLIAAKKEFEKL